MNFLTPSVSCPHESPISFMRKEIVYVPVDMEASMIVYKGTCERCEKVHTRVVDLEGQDPNIDDITCEDGCEVTETKAE